MTKAICPDCKRPFSNAKILAMHMKQPHMCNSSYMDMLRQDKVADAIEKCAKIAESFYYGSHRDNGTPFEIAEAIRRTK